MITVKSSRRQEPLCTALDTSSFVPVAPRVAFSGMRQARIENNIFIYLFIEGDSPWEHS